MSIADQTCPPHEYECLIEFQCVIDSYICDGDNDCVDGSDEFDCGKYHSLVYKTNTSLSCSWWVTLAPRNAFNMHEKTIFIDHILVHVRHLIRNK